MLKYELKKFFAKTANRVILTALILIAVVYSLLAAESMSYTDTDGSHLSGIGKMTAGRRLAADKNRQKGAADYQGLRRLLRTEKEALILFLERKRTKKNF